ncbi:MAG: hypothetical protein KIT33_06210 [Candidatus Kapabacteria bacterium]|nr:hypothetical protein [Ignavibacteriota bacterium]MCW5884550.1 hypothetical protein [Candidatus Kapabacteria bacterium]
MKWHLFVMFSVAVFLTISCNETTSPGSTGNLHVKFENVSGSWYSVTAIEMQPMGKVGDTIPKGLWSDNIIKGKKIAPGQTEYFYVNIPSGEWSNCRIGIEDSTGKTIMLHQQEGYHPKWNYSITHWATNKRTVSVAVARDRFSKLIEINYWGDWTGHDN